ncbi:MAG: UDP-N-acetylmuramoyl-tripeptide--D-alanyl-D-alanine ligase [Proteobacteria bacterium]|nr:UDP-N-acetylmuramoyl-tripeptide--D-alanyl-D-alanine ligase [Pseudomonadota bacterium]MBU1640842.1 UDP-N-acetylmuramoyl-tripeptide--D-alanyl-D-alanine ligase [Pseudomonadota bacterium]
METLSCRDVRSVSTAAPTGMTGVSQGDAVVEKLIWKLSDVLLATGGRYVSGPAKATFANVSTDTRTIEKGDLFLALSGANFDGAEFALDAVRKGAGGIIVETIPEGVDVTVVQVDDTLRALGDLAAYRRATVTDLKVVAITGSSGKTSVKEMTATILGQEFNVLKTKGNFNNLIGMPLSLLPVDNRHDVAVLEMGMNRSGEIARMTEIADPDIACIVNVQAAHLSGLGSVEGVARAKGELFAGCNSWSKICVNYDDKMVRSLARKMHQDQISYGRNSKAFIRATHVKNMGEKGMAFTLHIGAERLRLQIGVLGEHNVSNALAAAAIAHGAGLEMAQIVEGLEKFKAFDKRLQIMDIGGLKIINDCYNANPASMMAAFDTVQAIRGEHKTIAILGDMLELGAESEKAHRRLGEMVACKGFDYLLVYGEYSKIVAQGAMDASMPLRQVHRLPDKEAILQTIFECMEEKTFGKGDYFLVKGSRGMCMEKIIDGLQRELG